MLIRNRKATAVNCIFKKVTTDKKQYLELLLLADEQENMVDRYLGRGAMWVLEHNGAAKAVCVVTDEGQGILEIKNLAVVPACQRQGYGKAMIEFIAVKYAGYKILRAGTGDSPLTIPFYRSCGFKEVGRIADFFINNYDHPIIEAGVLLKDMVVMERDNVAEKLADMGSYLQ